METRLWIPILTCLLVGTAFYIVSSSISSVILFVPGIIVAFVIYLRTFYKKMPQPGRILPLYLTALAIQMIHFLEEYLTDFVAALPNLLGQDPYPEDMWIGFNLTAYTLFIFGGIPFITKTREWTIIPIFFILVGVLFNGVAHIGLSIYVGGYFPGLYTALLYVIIGPILIKRVFEVLKIGSLGEFE